LETVTTSQSGDHCGSKYGTVSKEKEGSRDLKSPAGSKKKRGRGGGKGRDQKNAWGGLINNAFC